MAALAMIHADPEPRYGYRGRYGQSRGGYGGDTARSSLLPLPKSGAGPAVTVAGKFPVVRNSPAARTATAARRTPAARRAPVARPAPFAPAAPVSRPTPVSRPAPASRPAPVAPVAPAAPIVPAATQAPDFGPDLPPLAPRQEAVPR